MVTVSYNHSPFIKNCIESIVNQKTNFVFEHLVADDCSTDGTQNIIFEFYKRYPNIVRPIIRKKNLGKLSGNGRANGFHAYNISRGKYIAICEGDDYWTDPYKLQKQVDYLEANPDCSITSHQVMDIDEKGNLLKKGERKIYENSLIIKKYQYFDENFNETASQPGSWVFRSCLINSLPNIITKVNMVMI